jgi:hypothetical protein
MAARQQGQIGRGGVRGSHRRTHGGQRHGLRVAPASAALHVGKVIAERGDAHVRKPLGDGLQRAVAHVGAGAMPEHQQPVGTLGAQQQRGHLAFFGARHEPRLGGGITHLGILITHGDFAA